MTPVERPRERTRLPEGILEEIEETMRERIEAVKSGEADGALLVEGIEEEEGVFLVNFGDGQIRVATEDLNKSIKKVLKDAGVEEGVGLDDERDENNRPLALTEFYCSSNSGKDDIFVIEERVLTKKVEGRTIALRLEARREEKPLKAKAEGVVDTIKEKVFGLG